VDQRLSNHLFRGEVVLMQEAAADVVLEVFARGSEEIFDVRLDNLLISLFVRPLKDILPVSFLSLLAHGRSSVGLFVVS
jgi:hypothetical protein